MVRISSCVMRIALAEALRFHSGQAGIEYRIQNTGDSKKQAVSYWH
jgi:hypothetical protein